MQQPEYYSGLRPEMVEFLPEKYMHVLEIGCGEGDFSTHLKKAKEIWGLEMDAPASQKAEKKLYKVLKGTYDETYCELPDNYFDLIICNDVIEHMPDHDFFFSSIKKKMKPGAYMVISVPNVRYIRNLAELLIQKDWRYREQGTLDRTHLRYFTEKSIKRTLNDHGFTIEKFHGIIPCPQPFGKLIIYVLNILTLGYYSDLNYLDFGMRIRTE